MEFKSAQVSAFLNKPDKSLRVFLLFGPDEGLVRERAKKICLTAVSSLDDPFCYTELNAGTLSDDPARLMDEVGAISMMGGDRVVRLRGAGNTTTNIIKQTLEADFSNCLLVIEAGDIRKDSSLVKTVKSVDFGVIIPCFRDKTQDITALIQEVLKSADMKIAPDAAEYLRQNLGSDHAISRQELDKLVLYMASETLSDERPTISLEDVRIMIGDSSADSVFDVIDAALLGNLPNLEKTLNKAFFSGESPVTFLRLIQIQLKQLHKAAAFIDSGLSSSESLKKSGIPFFNHQKAQAQLSRRRSTHFSTCLDIILQAEMDCKTTGYPAEALCRRAFLRSAMANRRR